MQKTSQPQTNDPEVQAAYETIMNRTPPSKRRALRRFYEAEEHLWHFNADVIGFKDIHNDLHRSMCAFSNVKKGRNRKAKLFLVPRGHLKSSNITIGKSIQWMLRNPDLRFLIANATDVNASKFVKQIGSILRSNPGINAIWPERIPQNTSKTTWSGHALTLNRKKDHAEATIESKGVEGSLESRHYEVIIYDDIVNQKYSRTEDMRSACEDWHSMTFPLLEPDGWQWYLGTRYHYLDLYQGLIDSGDYDVYLRKVIEQNKDGEDYFIFPQKFNQRILDSIRKKMNDDFFFFSQYYNEPIDKANATFRPSGIHYYGAEEETPSPKYPVFFTVCDLALPGKGHDFATVFTAATDQDEKLYLYRADFGSFTPNRMIQLIHDHWNQYRPVAIGIETGGYQGSLIYNINDYCREHNLWWPIVELKPAGRNKDHRIRALEPRCNPERPGIFFRRKDHEEIVRSLLFYPKGRKDIPDTLAYFLDITYPAPAQNTEYGYEEEAEPIFSATGYRRY